MHQAVPEFWMICHGHLGIPRHRHKNGVDTRSNWRHEYLADLQSNEEGECHNDRRECPTMVVCGVSILEIEIS